MKLSGIRQVLRQPIKPFVEAGSVSRTARLHKPLPVCHAREAKLLGQVCYWHRVGKILLVGKHEDGRVAELLLANHLRQFLASLDNTIAIVAVNDVNQTLRVRKVMACTNFRCSAQEKRTPVSINR
jgi:hypothetical protein